MLPPRLAAAPRLDPAQCAVFRVHGGAMAPTIPAGSSILVDRSRTRRRDGQIFVLRTAEGIVVKCGEERGRRLAARERSPGVGPAVFPDDAVILVRVVWTARALV